MNSSLRRLVAFVAAAPLLSLLLLTGPPPSPAGARSTLSVVDEPITVDADGVYSVTVDVRGFDPDHEVAVTIYGVLDEVDQLDADLARPIHHHRTGPLAEAPVHPDGTLEIHLPIRSRVAADSVGENRLWIPEAGVHPVDISVRDAEGVIASARTLLIRLPRGDDVGAEPLPVAVVLGVGASDGDAAQAAGVTPAQAIALLADRPDLPVTVLLGDGVLIELEADPGLARAFAAAVGDRPVVAVTEPALDPSALVAIGHGDLYGQALDTLAARLEQVGLEPEPTLTPLAERPTSSGAGLLLDGGAVVALDTRPQGATSGSIDVDGRLLHVIHIVSDPELAADRRPAHRAQRSLARAILTTTDDEDGRAVPHVLAVVDQLADPLPALGPLLDQVGRGGAVMPVTLVEAAPSVTAAPLQPAVRPRQDLAEVAPALDEARRLLDTYRSYHAGGEGDPATLERTLLAALDRSRSPDGRRARVERVAEFLRTDLDAIALPGDQRVTLASRSALIPLTIENGASGPRQVLLRFRSDKFEVAEEGLLITVEPGVRSIDVHLQARSLGMSPLQVTVLSPDGQRVLATTRFEVRSTAIPGLGLLITGGGLILLAGWWYVSIRRSRADRPERSTREVPVAATPGGSTTPRSGARSTSQDRDGALAGGSVGS